MALTTHWEWRAFGVLSPRFRSRFETLAPAFEGVSNAQRIIDDYLWVPGCTVNLKFREGAGEQDGLKFKRLRETRDGVEKWTEAPDEIFPIPLSSRAWALLLEIIPVGAGEDRRDLALEPPLEAGRSEVVQWLQSLDPRVEPVRVRKQRRAGLWGARRNVKVELAEILEPTKTSSVGLEIQDPLNLLDDAGSIALLSAAIADLSLGSEDLEVMNYMDYIRRGKERS